SSWIWKFAAIQLKTILSGEYEEEIAAGEGEPKPAPPLLSHRDLQAAARWVNEYAETRDAALTGDREEAAALAAKIASLPRQQEAYLAFDPVFAEDENPTAGLIGISS